MTWDKQNRQHQNWSPIIKQSKGRSVLKQGLQMERKREGKRILNPCYNKIYNIQFYSFVLLDMSRIWKAGDEIPKRYHELGEDVKTPPLNLSLLTRTQRNQIGNRLHKTVIVDKVSAVESSPAAHVRSVISGVLGDYNRQNVKTIEYGSHYRILAMFDDYCNQVLGVNFLQIFFRKNIFFFSKTY